MIGPKDPETSESSESELLQSTIYDHLGLVAGSLEELESGDRIDGQIAQDFEEREVSIRQSVKAMVLIGLGFVRQSRYLTPQFFDSMPTERLGGEGIQPIDTLEME